MTKTKLFARSIILFCLLLLISHSAAQDQSGTGDLVQQLIKAYNNFDYEKSAELLNIAFRSLDRFNTSDQKKIYQYAAFIAFQNGNTGLAANHFWNLLEIDPTYTPDPVTTSPKLLTLFQKTKIEFLEDMNRRLQNVRNSVQQNNRPWRGFLFPGWEQWHRGQRVKGLIFAGAGAACLGGFVYSMIQTAGKKSEYRDATTPADIRRLYDSYNSHYQRQFYFAYAFAATWLLSQIDLTIWNHPQHVFGIRLAPAGPEHAILQATLRWNF